jgi:hypothetical protein
MVPCKAALADVVYFRMLTTSVDATVMYCGILQAFGDMFHLGHGRITYTRVQVYITESISKGSLVSKLLAGNGWAAAGIYAFFKRSNTFPQLPVSSSTKSILRNGFRKSRRLHGHTR